MVIFQGHVEDHMTKENIKKNQEDNKKRGAIYLPKTDLDEAREIRIARNAAEGKDTPLSELE